MRWMSSVIALTMSVAVAAAAQQAPDSFAVESGSEAAPPIERVAVGAFDVVPCAGCTTDRYRLQAPEGPVDVLVVRGQNATSGERIGYSFVTLSWYQQGVGDGAGGTLNADAVRDLVGDSVAAAAGTADRLGAAGTMQIGSASVPAMAVTIGPGLTARVGALAHGDGVLVVASFIRAGETSVAALTNMLQTLSALSAPMDTL